MKKEITLERIYEMVEYKVAIAIPEIYKELNIEFIHYKFDYTIKNMAEYKWDHYGTEYFTDSITINPKELIVSLRAIIKNFNEDELNCALVHILRHECRHAYQLRYNSELIARSRFSLGKPPTEKDADEYAYDMSYDKKLSYMFKAINSLVHKDNSDVLSFDFFKASLNIYGRTIKRFFIK